MTGRHCFRNRTWSRENITLVWCSASLALFVPHGFNAAEVMGTLARRMERIREHNSCRSRPQPALLHVRCLYGVIWSISEGGYEAVGSTADVQSNVSPPGTTYDSGARSTHTRTQQVYQKSN
ncbi:hypothetical protein CPAR01_04455 [Colletotrichum paranaense]|uniref:Uncharacterized protein n=2 Tax=Colletotrichum acutatum species complex TaxID=2707335 RepID=A0AAI9XES2_9PEZI|nr:uncharacterized protein CPAR01_04455 [Colletotrichum paranaense]KAK1447237.1 hypothetical protein CMEL01_09076 [Colletotrichum melonis]KAK1543822.1 hypothetical protein CPAR01_04455 [Colletotrichum paranaense]